MECSVKQQTTNPTIAMQAYNTLEGMLPFLFKLFSHDSDEVSGVVVQFISNYVSVVCISSHLLTKIFLVEKSL